MSVPIHPKPRSKKPTKLAPASVPTRDGILEEWSEHLVDLKEYWVEQKQVHANRFGFEKDNRGGFWKCVSCECCVHEQCMDFVDHWEVYHDENFHCKHLYSYSYSYSYSSLSLIAKRIIPNLIKSRLCLYSLSLCRSHHQILAL